MPPRGYVPISGKSTVFPISNRYEIILNGSEWGKKFGKTKSPSESRKC